jgi:hypothetical protein
MVARVVHDPNEGEMEPMRRSELKVRGCSVPDDFGRLAEISQFTQCRKCLGDERDHRVLLLARIQSTELVFDLFDAQFLSILVHSEEIRVRIPDSLREDERRSVPIQEREVALRGLSRPYPETPGISGSQ